MTEKRIESFQGEHRWLSNFWPVTITWDGVTFPSVENAYQAAKTTDMAIRERIAAMTPGQAKRAGRRLVLRGSWDGIKVNVMEILLNLKFQDHPANRLGQLLRATGDQPLVEGNCWGDTFWGVYKGVGRNELGKALMRVRARSAGVIWH